VPSLNGLSIAAATRKLERRGFTVEKRSIYSDKVPKYGFRRLVTWSGFDDLGIRHHLCRLLEGSRSRRGCEGEGR
jgi:hypothetical protein